MKKIVQIGSVTVIIAPIVVLIFSLAGCSSVNKSLEDIKRILGAVPGTFYNFGADGQIVFEAHCASMAFEPDTDFDIYNSDMKLIQPSSVVKVTCGSSQFSTVGFTSVYMSDGAKDKLFANSQQFADVKVKNNDRTIPLVNFVWRDIKNKFVGTSRAAQVCDQNNNPILAFAGDEVVSYSTDVAKSTMFQIINKNTKDDDGYVWISHGSYTILDTALMN
jgi:hypothetical protein